MERILAVGSLLCSFLIVAHGASWSYEGDTGPAKWKDSYDDCGAVNQSPIDINSDEMEYDPNMGEITFVDYDADAPGLTLLNNGHAVQVDVSGDLVHIKDGKLDGEFRLVQFHFHWADNDEMGAEHHLNGELHPMEVHFVHYNDKYPNVSTAASESDGLAVIGVFIEADAEEDHPGYARIISQLGQIPHYTNSTSLTAFPMKDLMPDTSDFFRYTGSLTTPPCYESVTWTVLEQKVKISPDQMAAFRTGLYEGETADSSHQIVNNYRPAQPLNDRTIYANHEIDSTGAAAVTTFSSLVVSALALFALLQ